jgi:hypothetical protein
LSLINGVLPMAPTTLSRIGMVETRTKTEQGDDRS